MIEFHSTPFEDITVEIFILAIEFFKLVILGAKKKEELNYFKNFKVYFRFQEKRSQNRSMTLILTLI